MAEISPHSIIEKGAKIGRGVRVGAFSYIGPNVKIGRGCVIENNVTIVGRTAIGTENHVFQLAVVGAGLEGEDGDARCVIGNANTIRENVTIYGSRGEATRIGNDNLIMISSNVGPGVRMGNHGVYANYTQLAADAETEDYVRTSGFSYVDEGCRIGAYTFVAAFTHVNHDAPSFAMIQGSPFRVRGANTRNLRSCGFGESDIRALKQAFRDLYNGSGELDMDVLEQILADRRANRQVKKLAKQILASRTRDLDAARAEQEQERRREAELEQAPGEEAERDDPDEPAGPQEGGVS